MMRIVLFVLLINNLHSEPISTEKKSFFPFKSGTTFFLPLKDEEESNNKNNILDENEIDEIEDSDDIENTDKNENIENKQNETSSNNLITLWQNSEPIGEKKFSINIKNDHDGPVKVIECIFSWNLNKNYWKFEYLDTVLEIVDGKFVKNSKIIDDPNIAFFTFLQQPIEKWKEIITLDYFEHQNGNTICLIYFKDSTIQITYSKQPFAITNIGFFDDEGEYFEFSDTSNIKRNHSNL